MCTRARGRALACPSASAGLRLRLRKQVRSGTDQLRLGVEGPQQPHERQAQVRLRADARHARLAPPGNVTTLHRPVAATDPWLCQIFGAPQYNRTPMALGITTIY